MLPAAILMEQVEGFGRFDSAANMNPMDEFSAKAFDIQDDQGEPVYVAACVFKLNSCVWLTVNRPRFIAAHNKPGRSESHNPL